MKAKGASSKVGNVEGPISEDMEAHLLKSLQSAAIEVTPQYRDAKQRALEKWRGGLGAKKRRGA